MRYSIEVEINAPVAKVVELFDADNDASKIEGMTETVLVRDLPREFSARYEFHGVSYVLKKHFEALGPDKTRYICDQEFQFAGMMKVLSRLMPWVFKWESRKHSNRFKAFVEGAK